MGMVPSVEKYSELQGVGVSKWFANRVQQVLDDERGLRLESPLVFILAPVVMQSMPGMLEEMEIRCGSGGRNSTGTALNSCHMWRSEGPLDQMTTALRVQHQKGDD